MSAVRHYPHTCLSCGCTIDRDDDEELVPGMGYPRRYRHKDYTGCEKALRYPEKALDALNETVRRRDSTGRVFRLPALDEDE